MLIRKTMLLRETTETDASGKPCEPIVRVVAMAVIGNPFAGKGYVEDLSPLFDTGAELGERLMADAVAQLGRAPVGYGKGALVGTAGEMEHGAAMVHPKLGAPMRAAVGGGKALIPSNVKVAGPGASLDLPLGHKDEPRSFDHIDTITVMAGDAPRPDEIVVVMGVTDGPRPHARVGKGPGKPPGSD